MAESEMIGRGSTAPTSSSSIDSDVIARVGGGIGQRFRDAARALLPEWFGPGQAVSPQAPASVMGRALDYPFGFNQRLQPRQDAGGIGFQFLRNLADSYDLLRILIENRKDKLCDIDWSVRPRNHELEPDAESQKIQDFFERPEPDFKWDAWVRKIMEDYIVIDAVAIYPRRTMSGDLYSLETVDAGTIKRLIGEDGRTPMPPESAYQQILKGLPANNYTSEQLIYSMRNPRSNRIYGYSKVEQIIMTIQQGLLKQLYTAEYFTSGSMPDAVVMAPDDWTPANIKEFQAYFDNLLSGELAERRRVRFLPPGTFQETKPPELKTAFDEWLARVCCFVMGVSAQPFVSQVNRAVAETAAEQAKEEGINPWKRTIKSLVDGIIATQFGRPDLEFVFDTPEDIDPKVKGDIEDQSIRNGKKSINAVRVAAGDDPVPGGEEPFIVVGNQIVLVKDIPAYSTKGLEPAPTPTFSGGGFAANGQQQRPQVDDQAAKLLAAPVKVLAKVAPAAKPLDGERHSLVAIRSVLADAIHQALRAAARKLAPQISSKFLEATKASEENSAKADAILQSIDLAASMDALGPAISEATKKAGVDGFSAAIVQIGGRVDRDIFDLANENAEAYASGRAADAVTEITEATRVKLKSTIETALEEGWSQVQLTAEIEQSYGFSPERSELIARTEVAQANVSGNLDGYTSAGVTMKQWVTANDDLVDADICAANAAQGPIPIEEPFQSGHMSPLGHPRCRCDLVPVVVESSDDDADKIVDTILQKDVIERDARGLVKTVRSTYASGRVVYQHVKERDAKGFIKSITEQEMKR